MSEGRVGCVVLAGAPADTEVKQRYNVDWRAEVPLCGRPMADWVVRALRDSGRAEQIALVGTGSAGADRVIAGGESFLDNVIRGVEAAGGSGPVLIVSSDIPLAGPEAYTELVDKGLSERADFIYPIIRREDCAAKFPELRRTYLRLREGTFTGGNAVLIDRDFLLSARPHIERLYAARKKPLQLALMIGIGVLLRTVLAQKLWAGAVDIPSVEEAAGRVMGGRLKALISSWPEIGSDMDHPEDFAVAEHILAERS